MNKQIPIERYWNEYRARLGDLTQREEDLASHAFAAGWVRRNDADEEARPCRRSAEGYQPKGRASSQRGLPPNNGSGGRPRNV